MKPLILDQAVEKLKAGDVVAMPTETVYGLAARIDSESALRKIFSVKNRPFFDPLIVHVSSKTMAYPLTTDWNPLADFLAEHFWPGPLTLVLPKSEEVNPLITSGLQTVALRMPKHSVALSLIERTGVPLAAPSANRFGRTSPTTAQHVRSEFPDHNLTILDGGACDVGLESTVLLIERNQSHYGLSILRAGQVTKNGLEKALSSQRFSYEFKEVVDKNKSPGQMKHHYMPEIPLVLVHSKTMLDSEVIPAAEGKIKDLPDSVEGVEIRKPQKIQKIVELQLPEDPNLAARVFYSELRKLGESAQADLIYFRLKAIHAGEGWQALLDRLTKAASLILD
jgi:L-threonylcarbamoyladenylate synthase